MYRENTVEERETIDFVKSEKEISVGAGEILSYTVDSRYLELSSESVWDNEKLEITRVDCTFISV